MPATLLYELVSVFLARVRAGLDSHRCDAAATTDQRQSLLQTPAEVAVAEVYPLIQAPPGQQRDLVASNVRRDCCSL